jgi:hypothetical protein
MRDRLLNRLAFTVSMLVAMAVTTAVIMLVIGHASPAGRFIVQPAATASEVPGG